MRPALRGIFLGLAISSAAGPLWADDDDASVVTRLQRSGQILPLGEILAILRPVTNDRILEVEVDYVGSGILYEIYFLDPEGYRREIFVDARTSEVVNRSSDD